MPDRHSPRPSPRILLDGIAFGESPRWHDGRLWFCDWAAEELIAVDPDGQTELITNVRSFPFSIDWLPDGRLLIVSARDKSLLTLHDDGTLDTYADLTGLGPNPPNNEIVIDARGHVFVDGGGFDMMAGEPPAPGTIAVITPDRNARQVADGIAFGNGMAITADGSTLIVAESYGRCLTAFTIGADGSLSDRRTWAALGEGTPDGICVDAEGALWYADVPHQRCVRVREGGEVLETIPHDRGCFACMLGGDAGTTLFIVARTWEGVGSTRDGARTGQLLTVEVDVPHAGRP
jgi:sugar lactone lactonase YvrE